MVFLSLPLYKGQTITKLAENGRKGFRSLYVMAIEAAKQANFIFSTLVSYESQNSQDVKVISQTPTLGHLSSWIWGEKAWKQQKMAENGRK